jgi:predicted ribosome quality control (RQC) complex YloA/Tae2 family protein
VAEPLDLWLHASGAPGSHIVVRNLDGGKVPRPVVKRAAELAALHSKARAAGGKVYVPDAVQPLAGTPR